MKKTILLSLLFVSFYAFAQKPAFYSNVMLHGDALFETPNYYENFSYKAQEEQIAEQYSNELMDNTLLKAIGIGQCGESVSQSITYSITDSYENQSLLDYKRIGWDFRKFIKRVSKNERVRDMLAETACNILCDLCRLYPKDYKTELLKQIDDVRVFLDTMSRHTYYIEDDDLYKDEEREWDDSYGIPGFIVRRIIYDEISRDVLYNYADRLYSRISSVDNRSNKDILASVNINNEITYNLSASGNYYVANKTGAIIRPAFSQSLNVIQCYESTESNLYKIARSYRKYSNALDKWVPTASDEYVVVDTQGNILYQQE